MNTTSSEQGNKKKWLLVDGHNMAFRCFYAIPTMTTSYHLNVNAVYGCIRSIWKLEDIVNPDAVCIFFDAGGSEERRKILSTYKANRKPMPDELKCQIEHMNLLSIAHGYYIISHEGIEADDLLGAFARNVSKGGGQSYIASGDKDFSQCVCKDIYQMLPPSAGSNGSWKLLDEHGVVEKVGVAPSQIVDYLSLLGDTADNIRGVEGVGEKTAKRLLNQFHSIDDIFENLDMVEPRRIRDNLLKNRDLLEQNRRLISLQSVDNFELPEAKIHRSPDDIFDILDKLELKSLLTVARKRFSMQPELF